MTCGWWYIVQYICLTACCAQVSTWSMSQQRPTHLAVMTVHRLVTKSNRILRIYWKYFHIMQWKINGYAFVINSVKRSPFPFSVWPHSASKQHPGDICITGDISYQVTLTVVSRQHQHVVCAWRWCSHVIWKGWGIWVLSTGLGQCSNYVTVLNPKRINDKCLV